MQIKEPFQKWWLERSPREQRLLKIAGVFLVVLAFYLIISVEINALARARGDFASIRGKLEQGRKMAGELSREKELLLETESKWESIKATMSRSTETGIIVAEMEKVAQKHGVRLSYLEPGQPVERIYRDHLRAVTYKITIQGDFTGLVKTLKDLEKLPNPAEIRSIKVTAAEKGDLSPGNVSADVLIFIYSLNLPEWQQTLDGKMLMNKNTFLPLIQPVQTTPENIGGSNPVLKKQEPTAGDTGAQ
ncbi:general secretion pathway, M protein [Moorella thermoacetica]|uniref:General secretion pathway, M protein n=1 Tax=Neomoorella thermoacetica TaxID=1525 RepID=A0A1J5JQE1_NEOTH|nr:type II secretion system protein GspM [Moorella thermoacetica]OIQ07680.1 general secretion pathway, M protein [Moorella thermoacetica]